MSGSGGGGGYMPPSSEALQRKIEKARQDEQLRLDADVNQFLQRELALYNDRDIAQTQARLDKIAELLGDEMEIDNLLFGGSVAKHTYVDGLSDVDALVVLDRSDTRGLSADKVLSEFHEKLSESHPRQDVASIDKGMLAVTVRFKDGSEVQLLPAIRSGKLIKIPDSSGTGWNETNPRVFQQQLTKQNERLNGALVPTIKLVKSLISDLPKQQRLTGYHIEALALDAAKNYRGPMTPNAMLSHVLNHAATRSRMPISDISGQSRNVDDYLGKPNSTQRKLASQAIAGIRRRLDAATSIAQWKAMFGGIEK
jgi:hypothetical protein